MWTCRRLISTLTRRKVWGEDARQGTGRERSLNIIDLVGLGLGGSTGIGVYVLSAYVAHTDAGPAAILSVVLAGVTALLSGLCHAEMSSRLPSSGTSYVYSYSVVGELCAFVTGWSLILEHVLGAVVAAKAWSHYLDYMLNNTVAGYMSEYSYWTGSGILEQELDVLAFISIILATILLLFSVKIYSVVNFALITTSALFVLSFISVGFFHVHTKNWTRKPGFFPFGVRGIPTGASVLFYAFTGIDTIATSTEDVKQCSHNVPIAIIITCIVSFILYFGTTTSLTLSFPWNKISEVAPLAKAFEDKDIYAAKYIVGVGAILGLTAGILAALYVIPRIMVSMSRDGLLPRFLARISARTEAPVCATLVSGCLTAICALVLDFYSAVEMLSIASIFAYFLCALCVLCLRYSTSDVGMHKEYSEFDMENSLKHSNNVCKTENNNSKLDVLHDDTFNFHFTTDIGYLRWDYDSDLARSKSVHTFDTENIQTSPSQKDRSGIRRSKSCCSIKEKQRKLKSDVLFQYDVFDASEKTQLRPSLSQQSFNSVVIIPGHALADPDAQSWKHTKSFILAYIMSSSCLCCSFIVVSIEFGDRSWWAIAISCVSVIGMVMSSFLISRQPQNRSKLLYRTPYVPVLPLLAMFLTMVLISALSVTAWSRFAVWLFIGLVVYWVYGVRHSTAKIDDDEEVALYDVTERRTMYDVTERPMKVPVQ